MAKKKVGKKKVSKAKAKKTAVKQNKTPQTEQTYLQKVAAFKKDLNKRWQR